MAKTFTSLTIFVSGPSDAEAEKAALKVVVSDVSGMLEKTHGITLRLLGWPDSFRPGVGTDPQSVINQQLKDQYDVYLGILGTRFGQPTPRAGSGTAEEFEGAIDRFRKDTTSVRVLFYFNRMPVDPLDLDTDQLSKVQEFKGRLGAEGVLYRDFSDTGDFAKKIREHLYDLVHEEWSNNSWTAISLGDKSKTFTAVTNALLESSNESVNAPLGSSGALGVIELHDEFERAVAAAGEILVRLGAAINEHTRRTGERTDEIKALSAISNPRKELMRTKLTDIAARTADDMDVLADVLASETQKFRKENRSMFDNWGRAIDLQQEFAKSPERFAKDKAELEQLVKSIRTSRDSTVAFQSTVSRTPAMTGKLMEARKRLAGRMGELIAELQFAIQEGERILYKFRPEGDSGGGPV